MSFLIFFCLISISLTLKYPREKETNMVIHELDDYNFDYIVQSGSKYKWLVLIDSDDCVDCLNAKTEINSLFKMRNQKDYQIGYVDSKKSPITVLRFEVNYFPQIFIVKDSKMMIFNGYPTTQKLNQFLDIPLSKENAYILPEKTRLYFYYVHPLIVFLTKYEDATRKFLKLFGFDVVGQVYYFQLSVIMLVVFCGIIMIELLILTFMTKLAKSKYLNKNYSYLIEHKKHY